jgi:hypothetical protein
VRRQRDYATRSNALRGRLLDVCESAVEQAHRG